MSEPEKKRNHYSESFKREMVSRYCGCSQPVTVFARENGIEQSMLHRWIRRYAHEERRTNREAAVEPFDEITAIKTEIASLRESVTALRSIVEKAFLSKYAEEDICALLQAGGRGTFQRERF